MAELFSFAELKSDKVFPRRKIDSDAYEFAELDELKGKRDASQDFTLKYGQGSKVEAKKILVEAKQLSQKMLDDTQSKINKIEKAGFDKGYSEGQKQAFEDGREKLEPVLEMFKQNIEKLFQCQKDIYTTSENEILTLITSLTSRLVNHEVRTQKDIILGTIRAAVKKILNREQATIRLNPEDMEFVLRNKPILKNDLDSITQVSFQEDSNVTKGGCVIDTEFGSISAIIGKEFEEFDKLLKGELREAKSKEDQGEEK